MPKNAAVVNLQCVHKSYRVVCPDRIAVQSNTLLHTSNLTVSSFFTKHHIRCIVTGPKYLFDTIKIAFEYMTMLKKNTQSIHHNQSRVCSTCLFTPFKGTHWSAGDGSYESKNDWIRSKGTKLQGKTSNHGINPSEKQKEEERQDNNEQVSD